MPLPPEIVAFNEKNHTGISDELLADAPLLSEVIPQFLNFVGKDPVIVGHNMSGFDIGFIKNAVYQTTGEEFECSIIDTLQISRAVEPEDISHKLSSVFERSSKRHSEENPVFHTAIADTIANLDVLEYLRDTYFYDKADIEQLNEERARSKEKHEAFYIENEPTADERKEPASPVNSSKADMTVDNVKAAQQTSVSNTAHDTEPAKPVAVKRPCLPDVTPDRIAANQNYLDQIISSAYTPKDLSTAAVMICSVACPMDELGNLLIRQARYTADPSMHDKIRRYASSKIMEGYLVLLLNTTKTEFSISAYSPKQPNMISYYYDEYEVPVSKDDMIDIGFSLSKLKDETYKIAKMHKLRPHKSKEGRED